MAIRNRFAELHDEITAWRRDLHRHPELMFDVHRTAGIVAEKLREFGCDDVVTGIGKTGVVGVIRGRKSGSGKTIGLRADMDALPIEEATGAEYASETEGAMHACGHDGHTAMLLGAAKYLAETRNFDGDIVVIFQPAEEGGGGGREMVNEGLIDRFSIDEVYGMHNWPGMDVGQFSIKSGPFFAAADLVEIEITGRGGHAAKPHEVIDPTLAACNVVLALQSIVGRTVDPLEQVVVSITSFQTASTAFNVIPETVNLRGTVRTLDTNVQDIVEARLKEIAIHTAAAYGAKAAVDYRRNYPSMSNHATETEFAADAARSVSGSCHEEPPTMGGEDFSFMLNACPGAYILVGNGDTAKVHSPDYDFNDEAIPAGCSYWVEIAESRMPLAK